MNILIKRFPFSKLNNISYKLSCYKNKTTWSIQLWLKELLFIDFHSAFDCKYNESFFYISRFSLSVETDLHNFLMKYKDVTNLI